MVPVGLAHQEPRAGSGRHRVGALVDFCWTAGYFCAVLRANLICWGAGGLCPALPGLRSPHVSSQKRRLYSHLGLPSKQAKPVQERRGSECPRDGKSASGAGARPVPGGPGISRVCSMRCPPSSVPCSVGMSSSDEVLVGSSGPGGLTWSDLGSWPGPGG